ncbi:hypothetical protein [Lyngbya sp. CCY1209]|uniref:hypothetical protein n=1 Tax=Lyngbya sp. CCY1209 TaxID=2886103 RepID=UPI002D213405|nr:hypothetical protein [Lyngbya sp. CCY1209]MEB3882831.1 hypothetical protein [Lyngbya sp. CCY1209]
MGRFVGLGDRQTAGLHHWQLSVKLKGAIADLWVAILYNPVRTWGDTGPIFGKI